VKMSGGLARMFLRALLWLSTRLVNIPAAYLLWLQYFCPSSCEAVLKTKSVRGSRRGKLWYL